jgi:hypothetical protein
VSFSTPPDALPKNRQRSPDRQRTVRSPSLLGRAGVQQGGVREMFSEFVQWLQSQGVPLRPTNNGF